MDRGDLTVEAEMSVATFDPVADKMTTREQWQAAAEAWHCWRPTTQRMPAERHALGGSHG